MLLNEWLMGRRMPHCLRLSFHGEFCSSAVFLLVTKKESLHSASAAASQVRNLIHSLFLQNSAFLELNMD